MSYCLSVSLYSVSGDNYLTTTILSTYVRTYERAYVLMCLPDDLMQVTRDVSSVLLV